MSLYLAERFLLQAWKARAQCQCPPPASSHAFREHSPSLTAAKAVAKRLLFCRLFFQCTQASCAQQWHCQGWWRARVCLPCWHPPAHGTIQGRESPPGLGTSTAHLRPLRSSRVAFGIVHSLGSEGSHGIGQPYSVGLPVCLGCHEFCLQ